MPRGCDSAPSGSIPSFLGYSLLLRCRTPHGQHRRHRWALASPAAPTARRALATRQYHPLPYCFSCFPVWHRLYAHASRGNGSSGAHRTVLMSEVGARRRPSFISPRRDNRSVSPTGTAPPPIQWPIATMAADSPNDFAESTPSPGGYRRDQAAAVYDARDGASFVDGAHRGASSLGHRPVLLYCD